MDPFTTSFLSGITANIANHIMSALGRRLRDEIRGTDKDQALQRCVQAGVTAMVATLTTDMSEEKGLLAEIYERFADDPDVGRELGALFRGSPPDMGELKYLFEQAGYDPETPVIGLMGQKMDVQQKMGSMKKNPRPKAVYPWGDEPPDTNRANYDETGIGTTSAVGCFSCGASPYGCLDMAGNVWEWTRSLWGKDVGKPDFKYLYDLKDGREDLNAGDDVRRVLRGGAFDYDEGFMRCACRLRFIPRLRLMYFGFRVVLSL